MKPGIDWAAIGKIGIPGVIALAFTYSTITGLASLTWKVRG